MEDIEVRPVRETDASELATLLNEIISRGGTTAMDEPFAPDALARALLIGPQGDLLLRGGPATDTPVDGFSVARKVARAA